MSITAALSAPSPSSGDCGEWSDLFTVALSGPDTASNVFAISPGINTDVSISQVTIAAGSTTGTFQIKPLTVGLRTITISLRSGDAVVTTPSVTYMADRTGLSCPTSDGDVSQSAQFSPTIGMCTRAMQFNLNYFDMTNPQKNLYCGNAYIYITW